MTDDQGKGIEDRMTAAVKGLSASVVPVFRRLPKEARGPVKELFAELSGFVVGHVRSLERRIASLESEDRYRGVWQASIRYTRGQWCTHDGSLWHCNVDCAGEMPGTGKSYCWSLAVKRGQDAPKEAKPR